MIIQLSRILLPASGILSNNTDTDLRLSRKISTNSIHTHTICVHVLYLQIVCTEKNVKKEKQN